MGSYQFFHFQLTFIVLLRILATSNVVFLPKNKRVIIKEPSINGEGHTNYFIFKYFLEGQVGFGQDICNQTEVLQSEKACRTVVCRTVVMPVAVVGGGLLLIVVVLCTQ